jgi:hypothetical protein
LAGASELKRLFEGLEPPQVSGAVQFSAQPIPGFGVHRIGKDAHGAPCLLVTVANGAGGTPTSAPIVLSHLSVQHDVRCQIMHPEGMTEDAVFTLVRCLNADDDLVGKFLDVMEVVVRTLGSSPTASLVRRVVDQLAELFRALDRVAQKSVQGVWGELFIMTRARDPMRLAAAWHAVPGEAFDFSEGAERIEVKTASSGLRQHYFSLEQVNPPPGARVLIASLFVERLAGGVSLRDLLGKLKERLVPRPDLILRTESILAESLGRGWIAASDEAFDLQRAEESVQCFDPAEIPSVSADVPPGVTEVRFRSDLTGCRPMSLVEYGQGAGLTAAL